MSLIQSYIVQYRDLPINTLMKLKKKLKEDVDRNNIRTHK